MKFLNWLRREFLNRYKVISTERIGKKTVFLIEYPKEISSPSFIESRQIYFDKSGCMEYLMGPKDMDFVRNLFKDTTKMNLRDSDNPQS